jgi:hypothetical protein
MLAMTWMIASEQNCSLQCRTSDFGPSLADGAIAIGADRGRFNRVGLAALIAVRSCAESCLRSRKAETSAVAVGFLASLSDERPI